MNAHVKAMAKLLQDNGYRHHMHDVFRDFLELAACSIAARMDLRRRDELEERYAKTIARYEEKDQRRFPQVFAELVEAMELERGDVLGQLFGLLEQGNAAAGQFFTPFEVCRVMAKVTIGDGTEAQHAIAQRGFVTAMEPAVGAGAQIIALAEALQEAGVNYQQHLHVTAIDVDARAVHMAYIQFSLLHIPAVVVLGNALTLEEREHWYTPAHYMGLWATKLARGYALGSAMDGQPAAEVEPVAALPAPRSGQLDLFGVAA